VAVSVLIRNQEPTGAVGTLAVVLVTAGDQDAGDEKHFLGPQGEVTLLVQEGQFLMVDETKKEGA
jgi:hypothetical protein